MKLQDPITNAQTMSRSILRSNVAEESMGHLWQKFVSERLRFTSSVAEFSAANRTTGCRRNASSRKSTTRATMGGRRRNDLHINRIVLAIAKTPAIDTP
jgi:hypothetical protein